MHRQIGDQQPRRNRYQCAVVYQRPSVPTHRERPLTQDTAEGQIHGAVPAQFPPSQFAVVPPVVGADGLQFWHWLGAEFRQQRHAVGLRSFPVDRLDGLLRRRRVFQEPMHARRDAGPQPAQVELAIQHAFVGSMARRRRADQYQPRERLHLHAPDMA